MLRVQHHYILFSSHAWKELTVGSSRTVKTLTFKLVCMYMCMHSCLISFIVHLFIFLLINLITQPLLIECLLYSMCCARFWLFICNLDKNGPVVMELIGWGWWGELLSKQINYMLYPCNYPLC